MANQDDFLKEFGIPSPEEMAKKFNILEGLFQNYLTTIKKLADQYNLQQLKNDLDTAKKGTAEELKAREKYEKAVSDITLKAAKSTESLVTNVKKNGTDEQKKNVMKALREQADAEKKTIQETLDEKCKAIDEQANAEKKAIDDKLAKDIDAINAKYKTQKARDKHIEEAEKKAQDKKNKIDEKANNDKSTATTEANNEISQREIERIIDEGAMNATQKRATAAVYGIGSQEHRDAAKSAVSDAKRNVDAKMEERVNLKAQLEEAMANGDELQAKQLKAQLDNNKLEIEEARKEQTRASKDAAIAEAIDAMIGQYKQAYSTAENFLTTYASKTDARLQGSNEKFTKLTDKITSTLSINPFIKSTAVLEKLTEAVNLGIAYNLEQRSFLAGISDKIATTFNAFDSNLARIIKLQQADSTVARLGMEAYLTKFLNSTFKDTAYLSEGFDSVTQTITDAIAQLDYKRGTEFEFNVQKWMASLSSLGVSQEALNSIAQGINAIALGDVSTLAGNQQLQTLFVGASNKANLEYANLLLDGLNPENTNKLLEGVILYLQEIASNTDSQVVKSAYKDVLGIGVTDLKAISGLTRAEISNISNMNMSYSSMQRETQNQMSQLKYRVTLPEKLDNIYSNVMYSVASDMVNDPVMWAMDKMLGFMRENKLDISLPFVNIFGSGFDLNDTVVGLMEKVTGLGKGFSFMSNLLQGIASGGGTDLNAWSAKETLVRGDTAGFGLTTTSGTSTSAAYVTNSNTQDATKSTIAEAGESGAENVEGLETEEQKKSKERTIADLYDLFEPIIDKGSHINSTIFSRIPIEVTNKVLTDSAYNNLALTFRNMPGTTLDIKGSVKVDNIPSQISVSNIPSSIKVDNKDNSSLDVNIKSTSIALPVKTDSDTQVSVKISDAGSLKTSNQLAVQSMKVNIDDSTLTECFIKALESERTVSALQSTFFNNDRKIMDIYFTGQGPDVEVSNYKFTKQSNWNSQYQF